MALSLSKGWQAKNLSSKTARRKMKFCLYILRCSNGSYYVGHTDDVTRRLEEHNTGKGAEHTRKYRPVKLLYTELFDSECAALRRELQIKRWSCAKKAALIAGDQQALKTLARRRPA